MKTRNLLGGLVISAALLSQSAQAHWCHDLWSSAYNVVVKPAQDTVTVPSSGSATLDVYVQNNMGYPLYNFGLAATASGYTVSVSHQAPKKKESGSVYYLLPGEKLKYTLTISKSSGGSLNVENLTFNISFGSGGQDGDYGGSNGKEVVIRKNDNTISPGRPLSANGNDQAEHLHSSITADYGDLAKGIGLLMKEYCVGRASWKNTNFSYSVTTSMCPGTAVSATCGTAPSGSGYKYDYQHLWAAGELAYRKAAPNFPADVFRSQLICALNGEKQPAFQFFPYAILGYLGESATVRTFLQGKISSGSADEKAAAKTALLLFEDPSAAGYAQLHSDVAAALTSSNKHVQMLAATSLGIRDQDDAAVQKLIDGSNWIEPDTSDNGLAMMAAHLLNIVAWDRRGWAVDAADAKDVSFYNTGSTPSTQDKTAPKAPTGVSCATQADGGVRLSWAAVTQDVNGGTENLKGYYTYYGTTSRGAATSPSAFSYDHQSPASGAAPLSATSSVYPGLSNTQQTYFSVVAQDKSNNTSAFSQEVHCSAAFSGNSPPDVSGATATPLAGDAPLKVTFSADGVTDPDGNAMSFAWSFGDGTPDVTTRTTTHDYTKAGVYAARLSVTDDGKPALASPATQDFTITVHTKGVANRPPDCTEATVTPTSGAAPLTVVLDATKCKDPDGDVVSVTWSAPGPNFTVNTYNDAKTTLTLTTPGAIAIKLTARDSAADALDVEQTFTVNVSAEGSGGQGGGCSTAFGQSIFPGFALFVLARLRRRRRA